METDERPCIRVVSAEIAEDGRFLITQRLPKASLPLLWEFPGGRVRDGEADAQALERALLDRLGVRVLVGERLLEVRHRYATYDLTMAVYEVGLGGSPRTLRVHALAWVLPEEFSRYDFPGADQRTVDLLLADEG